MNQREAQAVNRLLDHLGIEPPDDDDAPMRTRESAPAPYLREQVALLAERAHLALGAGVRGADVERCWPKTVEAMEAGREVLGW
jgi:hypothetical protein